MSEPKTIGWPGKSGATYTYSIYPRHWQFNADQPGNYIDAKETSPGHFAAIHVGQTGDLNHRLSNLEQQNCLDRNGTTHLHAHVNNGGEQARLTEENDLILLWNPVCSTQHRRKPLPAGNKPALTS
jgi:hypothetical protein